MWRISDMYQILDFLLYRDITVCSVSLVQSIITDSLS